MRKFLSLLMVLFVSIGMAWATSVTYTVSSATAVNVTGTAPEGSTATLAGTGTLNSGFIQCTNGQSKTLTLTKFEGYKITGVTIVVRSNASKGTGSFVVEAGSDTIASIAESAFNSANWNGAWSTSGVSKVLTMTNDSYEIKKDENVVLTIACKSGSSNYNSMYIQSYTITYEAVASEPTTYNLYLKAGSVNYAADNAVVAAWVWKTGQTGAWYTFEETETSGVSFITIPDTCNNMKIMRWAAGTTPSWDVEGTAWNKTGDIAFPDTVPAKADMIELTAWNDATTGTWSKYVPVAPTYYVAGSMTEWATNKKEMTEGSYTFEGLSAGRHKLKVISGSVWHGFDKLNTTASNANLYTDNDGNICFMMNAEGNVTVAYDGAKITVTGTTIVAPTTKFTVTVPAGTLSAYIGGNFNNWTPQQMTAVDGEDNMFTFTLNGDAMDTVAYKYLAGAKWDYVEVKENGEHLDGNRTYAASDVVAKWLAVPTVVKFAKVKAAPVNWTGHYILAWDDLKPHSEIGSSTKDLVAAEGAPTFVDGDTISILEGSDYALDIRFSETAGAYSIKLPNAKYIKIPSANEVNEDANAQALYLAYFKGEKQDGVQISNDNNFNTSSRIIYANGTNYRSYTNKIDGTYKLPTLYRLVDEAFDCQDGPYAILVNGTEVVPTIAQTGEQEYDASGRKQYLAYLSLTKNDEIQVVNTSCGVKFLPAIEDAGVGSHFAVNEGVAKVDTTGCFDLYLKLKNEDNKLFIGAGICPEDTIRYYVVGDGEKFGSWTPNVIASKKDTFVIADLEPGKYKFRISLDGTWDHTVGFSNMTDTAAGLEVGDDNNIVFRFTEKHDLTIVYGKDNENKPVFKLIGDFYVHVPAIKQLKFVAREFANDGAKLAAYLEDKDGLLDDAWTAFFAPISEGNDTLVASIDAAYDSIQFVRFKTEADAPKWDGGEGYIWNMIARDSINYESLTYTFIKYVDFLCEGTWDVYYPNPYIGTYFATGDGWTTDTESNLVWDGKNQKAIVTIAQAKNIQWQAQAKYQAIPAVKGKTYDVSFKLLADKDVDGITAKYQDNDAAGFEVLFEDQSISLKKDVELAFAKTELDAWKAEDGNGVLVFDFGHTPAGTHITISDVEIVERDATPAKFYITGDSALIIDGGQAQKYAWRPYAFKALKDTFELNLKAGVDYKLKVTADGTWATAKDFEALTDTAAGLKADADKNICFRLTEDGKVKVIYKEGLYKLEGDFYVPTPHYFIAGSMTDWKENMVELLPLEAKADSLGISLNLKADSLYEFKVVKVVDADTTWFGLDGEATMKYGESKGWFIYESEGEKNQKNVGLQTTKEAAYPVTLLVKEDHLEVSVEIPVRYYAKYNNGTDWAWKLLNEKEGKWLTDTIVYYGGGMNIHSAASDEGAKYFLEIAGVAAKDTAYFTFNPTDSTLVATVVGAYVAPAPVEDGYYLVGTFNDWTPSAAYKFAENELNQGEYVLNATLAVGDEFKVIKSEGGNFTWYPAEGDNFVVFACYAGEKTMYFNPIEQEGWSLLGGHLYMEYTFKPGYYLVGSMTSWLPKAQYWFGDYMISAEYQLETVLTEGWQIKVAKLENNGEVYEYFPDGEGTHYTVDAAHSGAVTVYFRNSGNPEWAAFGGYIYIEPKDPTAIDITNDGVQAVKVLRNGQILIIKGEKTYNVQGQLVK